MTNAVRAAVICALAACAAQSARSEEAPRLSEYAGRYASGPLNLLTVDDREGLLAISPPYWLSTPLLARANDQGDTFVFALPEATRNRRIRFERNEAGVVVGVRTDGVDRRIDALGLFRRLPSGAVLPIEQIMRGEISAGVEAARRSGATEADLATTARQLRRFPSKAASTRALLELLAAQTPKSADLQAMLGDTFVVLSERDRARTAYQRALALDSANAIARVGLARLNGREPLAGEGYRRFFPYPIDALFRSPSGDEIAAVRRAWASRDLSPRDVEALATLPMDSGGMPFTAHVFAHSVHRQRHVNVVFVPRGAARSLPVVVDARGVDPDFTPLDLRNGSLAMRQLGKASSRFIFVVPAFRGESLILAGQRYAAGGDPTDGWDGATDDAIASLSVALDRIPEADPHRIAAFGQSRGGSVALLMGVRDLRVDQVIAQAAPTDWFSAMDRDGWRTSEVLREALADGIAPTPREDGGQFYQRYIQPVHEGRTDLSGVRLKMLAASVVYFGVDLRRAVAMYGEEDRSVPIANAAMLKRAVRPSPDVQVIAVPNRGHDLDFLQASQVLLERLTELEHRGPK